MSVFAFAYWARIILPAFVMGFSITQAHSVKQDDPSRPVGRLLIYNATVITIYWDGAIQVPSVHCCLPHLPEPRLVLLHREQHNAPGLVEQNFIDGLLQ